MDVATNKPTYLYSQIYLLVDREKQCARFEFVCLILRFKHFQSVRSYVVCDVYKNETRCKSKEARGTAVFKIGYES